MSGPLRVSMASILAIAAGCSGPAAPPLERPIANAAIEVITLPSSRPDAGYDAVCQTGAIVRLLAGASRDPVGQALSYEWIDTVDGAPTHDFGPAGPIRTTDDETVALLSTVAEHEIQLTVTASDGRKARTSIRVLVTSCEECGGSP